MNNEEKFKALLSDKLESKEFSFDQKHWVNMSNMIDRSREKKFRGAWLYILLIASVAGSMAVYLLYTPADSNMAQRRQSHTAATSSRLSPVTIEPTPSGPQMREKKDGHPIEKAEVEGQLSEEPILNKPTSSSGPKLTATPSGTSSEPAGSVEPELTGKRASSPVPFTLPQAATNNGTVDGQQASKKQLPENSLIDPPVAVHEQDGEPVSETTEEVAENVSTQTATATPSTVAAQAKADSTPAAPAVQTAEIVLPEPAYPRHHLYLEAGAIYLNGWKDNDVRDGRGMNWTGSVQYAWSVNRKLSLVTGVGYAEVGHLGAYSHSSKSTSYGFGERSDITIITPEKMCYLQIPLKLDYRIGGKHRVGVGYVFSSLLTVKSRVESYTEGYAYASGPKTMKQFGYTEGFNKFDSQVSVFYKYNIHPQLWVNAELLMGIMDSRTNSFFGTPAFERNSGIKLSILYNIFKK